MKNSPYTDEQIQFLKDNYSGRTASQLTDMFNAAFCDNRTKKGIQYILQLNGLHCEKRKNTWADGFTDEQKDFMRKYGPDMGRKDLWELFNQHFGTDVKYNTIRTWCTRHNISSPNGTGKFTSETSPRWNVCLSKDEFRSHFTEESFEHLVSPMRLSNIKYSIGDEIVRHNIPYIVVNDTFGCGLDGRIEKKSRYVWKQHHGDIPADHMIINMDNDPMNCDISNLRCIPTKYRAFLLHNSWWDVPVEIKEVALKWCELFYSIR